MKLSLCLLLLLLPAMSFAGNITNGGAAPRGQSMQAFTAVADDSSAVFYNIGGLSQIPGTQTQVGFFYIVPRPRYTNSNNNVTVTSHKDGLGFEQFLSHQLNKKWTLGVGIYSPFARVTDYPNSAALNNLFHKSIVTRVDLSPAVSYAFSDELSVGLGLVLGYVRTRTNILTLREGGDGFGFTANGGLLWKPQKNLKFGLSIRGPMTAKLDGRGTGGLNNRNGDRYHVNFKFPTIIGAGIAWQVNPKWLLSTEYNFEGWSRFKEVRRQYVNGNELSTLNGVDSHNFRIGTMYLIKPAHELRAGYTYTPAAIPDTNIIPAQPDFHTHTVSVGYSYYVKKKLRFDAGYEYTFISPVYQSTSTLFPGQYRLKNHIVMLGFAYKFGPT